MSEKIAEIVAQMRGRGEDGRMDMSLWRQYADRIEEAAKREKAEIEAEALAVGGILEAMREHGSVTESNQLGNVAAMREVVTALAEVILPPERPGNEDSLAWVRAMQVKARAALAAPPRQCDVGKPEEQLSRWKVYCNKGKARCLVQGKWRFINCTACFADWAQMPYKKEEGES